MKKIIMLLAFVTAVTFSNAQSGSAEYKGDPNAKPAVKKEAKKEGKESTYKGPWYNCGQCTFSSKTPGQCPNHKWDLVKEGMWHCSMNFDNGVSETEGRCPKCGMSTVKMEFRKHVEAEEKAAETK